MPSPGPSRKDHQGASIHPQPGMAPPSSVGPLAPPYWRIRHALSFYQRRSVLCLCIAQSSRRMAHESDGIAGGMHRLDERDRVLVLGQVPQRSVSTRIKDRVEVFGHHRGELQGRCERRLRVCVSLEAFSGFCLRSGLLALRIDGGCPPWGDASAMSAPASRNTK